MLDLLAVPKPLFRPSYHSVPASPNMAGGLSSRVWVGWKRYRRLYSI